MKVARNTTHNLRHDWLSASDEKGEVQVSLMTLSHTIMVDITINGQRHQRYGATLRELAEALLPLAQLSDR